MLSSPFYLSKTKIGRTIGFFYRSDEAPQRSMQYISDQVGKNIRQIGIHQCSSPCSLVLFQYLLPLLAPETTT